VLINSLRAISISIQYTEVELVSASAGAPIVLLQRLNVKIKKEFFWVTKAYASFKIIQVF